MVEMSPSRLSSRFVYRFTPLTCALVRLGLGSFFDRAPQFACREERRLKDAPQMDWLGEGAAKLANRRTDRG